VRTRVLLGVAGILLAGYGIFRILDKPSTSQPYEILRWLIGAVIVHDGIVVPVTLTCGAVLSAIPAARARRYLQGTLVAIAILTPPVLVEIRRRGTVASAKALLDQNYAAHLAVVGSVLAGAGLLAYLVRVRRDQRTSRTNVRPAQDHEPPSR
jgi:hypothetical protein